MGSCPLDICWQTYVNLSNNLRSKVEIPTTVQFQSDDVLDSECA